MTQRLDKTHNGYHYLATKFVLRLMSELLVLSYQLLIDNWYTSFEIRSFFYYRIALIVAPLSCF